MKESTDVAVKVTRDVLVRHRSSLASVPPTQVKDLPDGWKQDAGTYLANVVVDNVWLEAPLGDGWVVAYRVGAGPDGAPVVGEVRVFPDEAGHRPGQWSAELLGVRAAVP